MSPPSSSSSTFQHYPKLRFLLWPKPQDQVPFFLVLTPLGSFSFPLSLSKNIFTPNGSSVQPMPMEEESSNFGRSFGDSFAVQLTGQIMVIAVLVILVVVVFVILVQLYAEFFWLRTEEIQTSSDSRRSPSSQSLVFASRHDPAASKSRRGLDLAVLSSLPTVEFGSEVYEDGIKCAVCLSDIIDGEKARVLPKCNHGFHLDCIDVWFKSNSTCPICRNVVAPDGSNSIHSPLELDLEAQTENSSSGFPIELPDFPTNVLFWGDRREISTGVTGSPESSSSNTESDGGPGLDIPNDPSPASSSSSLPPSSKCYPDDEVELPVTTRLRSLKRLLSRETRAIPCIQHQHGFGCKTQQT